MLGLTTEMTNKNTTLLHDKLSNGVQDSQYLKKHDSTVYLVIITVCICFMCS